MKNIRSHILKAIATAFAAAMVLVGCHPAEIEVEPELNLRISKVDAGSKRNQSVSVKADG